MPETKELITTRSSSPWVRDAVWRWIDEGWSVVKAIYNHKKDKVFITITNEPWAAVTVPCSACGERYPPGMLYFRPYPSTIYTCTVCTMA